MSVKVKHLKDELRRTFTLYALIPTFIVSILVFMLAFVYWKTNVLERNQNRLDSTSKMLSTMISNHLEKTNEIAALCDINELAHNKTAIMEMYENLYQYINHSDVTTNFYLFDEKMNMLISNQVQEPEFVQLGKNANWGIIGQIRKKPTVPIFSFTSSIKNFGPQMDLVIGKAILEKGKIIRFSFSIFNTIEEVDICINVLRTIFKKI